MAVVPNNRIHEGKDGDQGGNETCDTRSFGPQTCNCLLRQLHLELDRCELLRGQAMFTQKWQPARIGAQSSKHWMATYRNEVQVTILRGAIQPFKRLIYVSAKSQRIGDIE